MFLVFEFEIKNTFMRALLFCNVCWFRCCWGHI